MPELLLPTVPQWFAGQNVLVTGATGFMGKILVEKLLRCCPQINRIYLMVRAKKGRSPAERLKDFVNSPVFDALRDSKHSRSLDKLRWIGADLTLPGLDVAADSVEELRLAVTVVFHMAANVRFDQPLRQALAMNTGGTRRLLDLVATFERVRAFVHVSTSYCHCGRVEVDERSYPAPHDPKQMLELSGWMSDELLQALTPHLLGSAPNTYAYTKCLTEQLVKEYATELPIAIARPSIVIAAWKEPIPGWIENLNGPTGLLVGAGKGVIRSMHCDPDLGADVVPVDVCINSIILTAWKVGTSPATVEPLIVNVVASKTNPITWGRALELGRKHFYDNPFSICLWYPGGSIKANYLLHMVAVFFLHTVPAYFVDFLLTVTRGKPFLVQTQKRISNGLEVLQYYTTRPWRFGTGAVEQISHALTDEDRRTFYVDTSGLDWDGYLLSYVLGARKFCVHEEPETIPYARKVLKRLYYLDLSKNVIVACLVAWFVLGYVVKALY